MTAGEYRRGGGGSGQCGAPREEESVRKVADGMSRVRSAQTAPGTFMRPGHRVVDVDNDNVNGITRSGTDTSTRGHGDNCIGGQGV